MKKSLVAQNGSFKDLLKNGGFQAFLWTQFLGALNDNLYKIIVSMRAVHVAASTGSGSEYLSLAGVVFVIPFLLFSGYSGHLADAVSKRRVLIGVKLFEIFAMVLGFAAFFSTRIELMLVVLFLMALHSTLFSPAKYGIVPEMLGDKDLSRANGLLEMSTFVAIVLGTSIGSFLFTIWKAQPWNMGLVMLGVSLAGFLASLHITRVPPSGATAPFRLNPFAEVWDGTKQMWADRPLMLTVLGISYFWFLGALLQMDLLLFGSEVLKLDDLHIGLMITGLALGIGAGSMLAGKLSGDKVELGLVPLGSVLIGVFSIGLYAARGSFFQSVLMLALLGLASGLFIVPLNAFLQQRGERTEKGRILSTNNFFNTIGMLLASAVLWLLHDRFHVSPDKLILVFGIVTLFATLYIIKLVPDFLVRFVLWLTTHSLFRIRIRGQENLPANGPALLVSNHISHVDGLLIGSCVQRFIRFLVWRPIYEARALNWFFRLNNSIPVSDGRARDMVESIQRARKELIDGHAVCIFAEGAISRTGNLLPFKRGFERIVAGMDVPIIPVHLAGVWGSIFSFSGGRFFWKWPRQIPYPVTVSFGAPMPASSSAHEVRQAIMELACAAADENQSHHDLLHVRFVRNVRKNWSKFAMADTTGRQLTYGQTLVGSVIVAEWIHKHRANDRMIGLLLPSSVGGALGNIGVTLSGKIPVNINFTAGSGAMDSAIARCEIHTVLTSRAFLSEAKFTLTANLVFIEDILKDARPFGKLWAMTVARLMPVRLILGRFGQRKNTTNSLATVIFSSGSTGTAKGVMLSHHNLISNIEAMAQVFPITAEDRIVGALPFFHSFGYTVTLWFPLLNGCGALYHPNPMEAKKIGGLIRKHRGSFLLSTPTFCANYMRKCTKEDFGSLRYVLVGAEKLLEPVARKFRETFGLELLEGYGCTEMSPVVAVNTPNFESGKDTQPGTKAETVGHALPGVAIRIVNPETMEPLGACREGLVLVRGPNRMLGYIGEPERTSEVIRDGWYVTGDIGIIDEDGFLRITDRLSRFSKIGGEMVAHLKIEDELHRIFGEFPCAVTGIPDEQRGERLVLLYTDASVAPRQVSQALLSAELPPLWVPKRENIYNIAALPVLGSGKLDLQGLRVIAQELANRRLAEAHEA